VKNSSHTTCSAAVERSLVSEVVIGDRSLEREAYEIEARRS
jgi:hypothetical protein